VTEGYFVSIQGKIQHSLKDIQENRIVDIKKNEIIDLMRSIAPQPGARVLIDFADQSEISIESLCLISSIYLESLENAIELQFHHLPPYIHQFFADIPEIDLISSDSYTGYDLVLICRSNELKRLLIANKKSGKELTSHVQ
jgi:hypothetical protein